MGHGGDNPTYGLEEPMLDSMFSVFGMTFDHPGTSEETNNSMVCLPSNLTCFDLNGKFFEYLDPAVGL